MTDKTQPEALRLALSIDLMDTFTDYQQEELNKAAAELRRQHDRIAELEAELEAVGAGGVQALSAAPAGFVPVAAFDRLHAHAESLAARLLAASPTPTAEQQAAPKAAQGVGNSGFDHKTAADFLNGKTVSDEAVRTFVAASRWAHDERAALSATLLAMHGVLTSREAEIALLKKALLEAEAAPQQEAQEPVAWLVTWAGGVHNYVQAHASELPAVDQGRRMAGTVTPLYTAPQPAPHLPERDASLPAERQGLFRKFVVRRVDGSDKPGGKHHGCTYFVLDVDHDPCARPALAAYAAACESTHPTLAADLRTKCGEVPAPQPAPAPLSESEYKLGYQDGYERRDAEVRGALV